MHGVPPAGLPDSLLHTMMTNATGIVPAPDIQENVGLGESVAAMPRPIRVNRA